MTPTKHIIYLIFSISFFLLISETLFSQSKDNYDIVEKHLFFKKPKQYHIIDSLLSKHSKDSIRMKALAKRAKTKNYLEAESYAKNALGIIYRNISLYEKAINAHIEARNLAQKAENKELEIISLNMLGVAYRRMDLVKPALDYHKKALDIANSIKNPSNTIKHSIAVSQNSMGNIYLAINQYDLAIGQFNKSLKYEKVSNNKLGLAINYQNIGYAKEAKGQLEEALKDYETSLNYNNEIDSEIGRVICYNSIGKIYIKQGKLQEALSIIKEALNKALTIGDQYYIASSYNLLGWTQIELNNIETAEKNINKALILGQQYNLKSNIAEAYKHLSKIYEKKKSYKLAMTFYKNHIDYKESISNERNLQYVNDVIVQYENEIKNSQIKSLAYENELVKSKLERNQRIFWFTLTSLITLAIIIVSLYRNHQLQHEKQILTLEQDMLRNQMNPHFIFNTLNSIKLYIINNEKENAVYYLNKFSKLIRKILVASTEKEISLEEELNTMKLYMNIENIRFSNEINFKIKINDNINISKIKVPSMVLQPFLENAIWHGLSAKKGHKEICIKVDKKLDNHITISIRDNGIGRKASTEINNKKSLKRKSMGIDLIKARLENFSSNFENKCRLYIKDIMDEKGNPLGTKVIINIPTQKHLL